MSAETFQLSTLDRHAYPCYVRLILCFPVREPTDAPGPIVDRLQKSLDKLQDAVPWLAARVRIRPGTQNGPELVLKSSDNIDLLVYNATDMMPSYAQLSERRVPQAEMKGEILSHMGILPNPNEEYSPAFVLQANFIAGGLLLTFVAHHCILDGTSMGTLIDVLARFHAGHELAKEEIKSFRPIQDRQNLFNGETKSFAIPSINGLRQYNVTDINTTPPYPGFSPSNPKLTVKLFSFTTSSLASLKASCQPSNKTSWISTNDALSALLWKSITRARHAHKTNPTSIPRSSILAIPINIRQRTNPPFPPSYLGNAYLDTIHTLPISTLLSSLPTIALYLRNSINAADASYIREAITLFRTAEGRATVRTPLMDVFITSWVEQPVYTADFGPTLGRAEWVRTPRRAAFDGIVTLMPRSKDGIEVGIELFEEDMQRLMRDEGFMRWVDGVND